VAYVDSRFIGVITGEIVLDHDEPEIVEKMIKFLYEGDYSDVLSHDDDCNCELFGPLLINTKPRLSRTSTTFQP